MNPEKFSESGNMAKPLCRYRLESQAETVECVEKAGSKGKPDFQTAKTI